MPEMRTQRRKRIYLFLRVLVVAAGIVWAMFWVSHEQRWVNLTAAFRRMNMGAFALALGLFVLCQAVIGLRWWLLLRSQSIFIDLWAAVRLYFLGWFFNNFMPSSVGGDLIRAWYVSKHTDRRFEAVLSVFVDRVIGLFSTLSVAAVFYWLFLARQGKRVNLAGPGNPLTCLTEHKLAILCVLLGVAAVFCVLLWHGRTRRMLRKVWLRVCTRARTAAAKLRSATTVYCRKPLTILAAFVLTVGMQIAVITGFWVLGVGMGIDVSVKYYYVFFTLMWVVAALPVSIGGAVVMEGGLAYLFVHLAGVEPEAALALALCQRVVWMIASVPGGLIHLIGAHLPKEFSVDYDEPVA
jgi:uncharacterized protein (TIRG00374 family)